VLLDHIPHNEESKPIAYVESTYQSYSMSVNIPDIKCDKCSIQLLYVMTDKTVGCGTPTCYYNPDDAACKGSTSATADTCLGAPNDNACVAEDECFSNCKYTILVLYMYVMFQASMSAYAYYRDTHIYILIALTYIGCRVFIYDFNIFTIIYYYLLYLLLYNTQTTPVPT
jgi:hypothetical protein